MSVGVNRVVLVGNLTRDPEQRNTNSGMTVVSIRLAVNTRQKQGDEWAEKPNYFDVTVFGAVADNCAKYLAKGRAVAVDGRLDWREWESENGKRQAVQVIADTVQFLGAKGDAPVETSAPDEEEMF